jgi:DNA polymerase III epsilon subunit-like protein
MSNEYPIKPATHTLSFEGQNASIIRDILSSLAELNEGHRASRRVTAGMAKKVATRSLAKTADQTYSLRRHRAFSDLSDFAALAQLDKGLTASAHTNLLPVSHPRSTRKSAMDWKELRKAQARWFADDSRVTDPLVGPLLASAFTAELGSSAHQYAVARLNAMGPTQVPLVALVAAFKMGGNKGFWRFQLRDSEGKFANMFGGIRRLVRRINGTVSWLAGRVVSTNPNNKTFIQELPDGRLIRTAASAGKSVKAILPNQQDAQGFSKTPAKSAADSDVVDEADLEFVDSPDGYKKDPSYKPTQEDIDYYGPKIDLGTKFVDDNDNYEVLKFDNGANVAARNKFEAQQQKEAEGNNVVALGMAEDGELNPALPVYFVRRKDDKDKDFAVAQSWADVQDFIAKDEDLYEAGEPADPQRPSRSAGLLDPELKVGDKVDTANFDGEEIPGDENASKSLQTAYQKKLKSFKDAGGEFPLDPTRSHFMLEDGTVIDSETGRVLRDSVGNANPDAWLDDFDEQGTQKDKEAPAPATDDTPETESPSVPANYYEIDTNASYEPQGATEGQESEDFTDDPAALSEEFSAKDLVNALNEGVVGSDSVPGNGFGYLDFSDGAEIVPVEAIYEALNEKGEDAKAILDDIYKVGNGDLGTKVPKGTKEALGDELPEAAKAEPTGKKLPALIEGMTKDEQQAFLDSGEYKAYLPENKAYSDSDVPEGYSAIDESPFNEIEGDTPQDAPQGFSVSPVDIANDYKNEELIKELRRSIEPGNATPGYGILGMDTPEGEQYLANVPAEAIRDALQLQGVDTDELIDAIYAEGLKGQNFDEPTNAQIQDAIDGEDVEEVEATPEETPVAELPAADEPVAAADTATSTPEISTGEPDGPALLSASAENLKAGDVTFSDNFVIENVFSDADSEAQKPGSVWIEGYYPGHQTQKTKLWGKNVQIKVYRNVEAPAKGDLPVLSKPKPKEFDPEGKIFKDKNLGVFVPKDAEARSKFLDALDEYNKNLAQAQGLWTKPDIQTLAVWQTEEVALPFSPATPVGITTVKATEVKAGDVTFKKEWGSDFYEYFIIEGVEEVDGKAVVQGYYPGHVSQTKEWNATTEITVMRGASKLPAPGEKPALSRPDKTDLDLVEKKAAFKEAKKLSAEGFTPPIDPDSVSTAQTGATDKPKKKTPSKPKPPAFPAFSGDRLKQIEIEAAGDPTKFLELLEKEEIIYLDFETAADGAFEGQTPIQVAWTKIKDGLSTGVGAYWMNPEVPLSDFYKNADPDETLKDPSGKPVSNEFLAEQPSIQEQMTKLLEKIGPDTIVLAHNVPFDGGIMKRFAQKFNLQYNPGGEIDTLSLARLVINGGYKAHTLQNVASRYGIVPNGSWHDAVTDSDVLPPILKNLLEEMAKTKQGLSALNVDANMQKYEEELAEFKAAQGKKDLADTSLPVSKIVKDTFGGDAKVSTVDEIIKTMPKVRPTSDEVTSATAAAKVDLGDGDLEIQSVLGDSISNNWVNDNENTTSLGKVPVEQWQAGDFLRAPSGGWFEVLEVVEDPADSDNMFVRRRLLINGKEYGMNKSWVKFQAYEIRRRNGEVDAPVIEEAAPNVDTETTIEKWQSYDIKQDADGVYYADGISSSDVQKLRNGLMTPPQLPFFAPMGGGNNLDQGDGYFFSANGQRFWGKFGAAGALVRRKNNEGVFEYFLAKRSSGLSQGGGKWGYPGGAHKDKGDSEENNGIITAINEFEEEVDGDLSPDFVVPVGQFDNQVAPDWTYNTHLFEVGPGQLNDLSLKDGENSEIGWFTADQISKMASQGTLQDNFAQTADVLLGLALDEPTTTEPDEITIPEAQSGSLGQVFDTSKWKKVAGQAGSNQGAFYVDPDSGQQYYVKTPQSESHAANEVLASALYEEAGLDVGRSYIGKNKAGKMVIVSPFIDGTDGTLGQIAPNQNITDEIKKGFAVDAWMNNYDVIGLEKDNIVVANAKPFRIDAGGALLFRAQGADKAKELDTNVAEQISSLRDSNVNSQAASVFGDMTDAEIAESAKLVANIDEAKIDELVDAAFGGGIEGIDSQSIADKLKENLKRRRNELIEIYGLDDAPIETPAASEGGPEKVLLSLDDIDPEDLIDDLDAQIQDAIATGNNIVFTYNGKTVDLSPAEVKTSQTGNVAVGGTLPNGKFYAYSLSKMEQANDTPSEATTPDLATPETPSLITVDTEIEPVEAQKPTEVPQDQKQKLLEKVENIAEALFGTKDPEKVKQILQGFLDNEVEDPELVQSILDDLNSPAPAVVPIEAPIEKADADIKQSLVPIDGDEDIPAAEVSKIDLDELSQELANPTDPDLIWAKVIEDYEGSVLDNGHVVVSSLNFGSKRLDVLVKRNSDNTFSIYHRVTDEETGQTRVKEMKGRWHSFTALDSRIFNEIYKSQNFPNKIASVSKKEGVTTLQPSMPPKQSGSYVSADGKTVVKVGMTVINTKTGKKGIVTSLKDQYVVKAGGKVYTYTDVAKVKFEGEAKANWKASTFLMPEGSQSPEDGPDQDSGQEGDGGGGGTPTPPTTPETPAPEAPTPEPEEVQPAEAVAPSGLTPESSLSEVESVAVDKNSAMHTSYFGASNKSEYKNLIKKYLVKDATSTGQNMLPGIIASNQDPDAPNPELASHGVITKTFPSELAVEVTYFDGPMKGTTQKLEQKNVWSREKFLTNEQSKELGIEVDDSVRAEAVKAQGAKAEEAKKQAVAQAAQQKKQKEEAAKKAVIEKAKQDLADKFTVEGPGFAVETLEGDADWSSTPLAQVPSLKSALDKVNSGDPIDATNGAQIMLDSADIEDLKVRIQKVEKDGAKQIRLSFKLTNWAGNAWTKKLAKQQLSDVQDTSRLDKYKVNPDGSLVFEKEWNSNDVDGYSKGRTYRGDLTDGKGKFQFIRANRSGNTPDFFNKGGSHNGSVSLHNRVELLLPEDATPEDIAAALKELNAIQEVRPAMKSDFKGVAENKIISLFGQKGNGAKNYEGELRKQILDEVEKNYSFTADNMEVRVDEQQKGIIQYLLPEQVAEQLAATYGVDFFKHNFADKNLPDDDKERADFVYDLLFKKGGGLYSTVTRWSEGINTKGQSSSSDLAGVGAGYIFTSKVSSMELNGVSYKSLNFFFDGVQLIRRPEFYGSSYDAWGKKVADTDYLELLKNKNLSEVLFKENLSWADLSGIALDSSARKFLLERLTAEGITEISGKPVEEMFGVK